jgi:hypothetical protein
MPKKISLLAIFACALALMLTVFSPGAALGANTSDSTQVVVPRERPVEVAFAVDLTGFASGLAPSLKNAVQMAVDAHPAVRGFPIQVNVVDAP